MLYMEAATFTKQYHTIVWFTNAKLYHLIYV